MPARTRIAAVTLLAAASAVLLPVTGAEAADAGHRDRTGEDWAVVRHDGGREPSAAPAASREPSAGPAASREPSAGPAALREETAVHPAAGTDGHAVNPRKRDPRFTHREHPGVSRPAARLRPAGRLHGVRQAEQITRAGQGTKAEPAGVKPVKSVKPVKRHEAASNPVRRMVQAGQTVGGRRDVGKPLAVGGAALLAAGGGAYGLRLASRRRAARADA
ncbi:MULTISPECIES: hypothetical protein [Streptomyces]|uniref:hypothetical protein n=1 Tax=Streptomyces TaxID=1883 RepID=UPI00163BCA83|nr:MULTISPECIES: hypothetical protein [Streptomyces]MBC2877139.1 hypothetical protein [Streptomyces sp. TYQ1024]UBI39412.1 hypothetical protein K7I03_25050 [Streptomyces mobaraensis]UKW31992.1 hypothetical protein MCU78_24985 [Streptomyces sp. TYQ1024]